MKKYFQMREFRKYQCILSKNLKFYGQSLIQKILIQMNTRASKLKKHSNNKEKFSIPHIKTDLVARLNNQVKKLNYVNGIQNLEKDQIFNALEQIEGQATDFGYTEIQKLAQLAKGKRILNIEIEKKRQQIENKKQKKKIIEDFFRENRIKEVDYYDLSLKKISQKSFIVQPYPSGRAFIQSDNIYKNFISKINKATYNTALNDCQYLPTIKKVNKIFYSNFGQGSLNSLQVLNQFVMRLGIGLLILELVFCAFLFWIQIEFGQYLLLANSSLLILVFLGISIKNFFETTSKNYQLQETIQQINSYFIELNAKMKEKGRDIEWKCPESFLYLQVVFGEKEPIRDDENALIRSR